MREIKVTKWFDKINEYYIMSYRSIRILRLLTPLSAIASFVAQGITVLTNEWLHTTELMPNKNYEKFTMPSELEYNKKFTVSGLWQLCHNERKS